MSDSFHFLPYAEGDAAANMALDEFFLEQPGGIYLRLYGWNPPAVSLGFGQKPREELDLNKLKRDKIGLVRRMTGGRAILHDREITYAIAADAGSVFGPTLHTAFGKIGEALKRSLVLLGIECELERGSPRDVRTRNMASPPCFASAARSEIVVKGRKLIGSAQKRVRRRFLQHGSLPLSHGRDLVDYLHLPAQERERYGNETRERATVVAEQLSRIPEIPAIEKAFETGFSEVLGLIAVPYSLSDVDENLLRRLTDKYRSAEWTKISQ